MPQSSLQPRLISHGWGSGFLSQFIWDGARDYSAALAIPAALAWWQWIGESKARTYMHSLVREAARLLATAWATETLFSDEQQYATMTVVRVPDSLLARLIEFDNTKSSTPNGSATSAHAKLLQDVLFYEFRIEVPVKLLRGALYVRISAHLYNHLAEYQRLADAVLTMSRQQYWQDRPRARI